MNKKILVSGATGTIGSFLVDELRKRNTEFVALVRDDAKAEKLNKNGIQTVIGDLGNKESLLAAMNDVEKVFLLSTTSPQSPELQGNVVKAAQTKGIKHIVKIAARGSAPDADFNIGRWHGITEEEIRESGIPYTFIHAHTFMQNLFFDAGSIEKENAIYSSQGDGKIPMVDARDIAAVAAVVLTEPGHEGKTYVVTGPEAVSYHDIAKELSVLLGREIKYIQQTPEEGHKAMLSSGMPEWLVDDMTLLNKRYASNEAAEVSKDVEKVTGRKAIPLRKFLNDFKNRFK
ncbi:MAG: SDR family oxidoreductase [Bacteroidetes bacterium]|nr:SDR family oxidoreductase [Bacteroidota bacterium]